MKENTYSHKNIKEDKLLQFITHSKYRFLRHFLAALSLFLLMWSGKQPGDFYGIIDHIEWIISYVLILSLFYVNLYVLVPRILYNGKLIKYLFALILVVSIACLILYLIHFFFIEDYRVKPLEGDFALLKVTIVVAIFLIPMVLFTTPLKMFQRWLDDTKRINELEIKAVESELEALRNQIQPHFLFNMLNNVNILTKRDPEMASQIIVKLSDFLRHLLYDSEQKEIYLSSEIRFLNDYLGLEKMRRDNFEFTVNYKEADVKGLKIPQNILLILVENAIKHSADPTDGSYVDLNIKIDNDMLWVHIINSVPTNTIKEAHIKGIGLNNIQRRLELLYGTNFYINSSKNEHEYIATLKLPL